MRLEELEDEAQRSHVERQLERLRTLAGFALPVIGLLDALPKDAVWSEWLEALAPLAGVALRNPDGVLAVLAEFEPMGGVGPVRVEEVAQVLSERLRFLRPEPRERRWGRVFVGSIDEARGCEFRVVFVPGLAEGLFPQRTLEDPLLLDEARQELNQALGADLPLRKDRNLEEREKLHLAVAAASERFIASFPRMDAAEARRAGAVVLRAGIAEGAGRRAAEAEGVRGQDARGRGGALELARSEDGGGGDRRRRIRSGAVGKKAAPRYLMDSNGHLARSLRARYSRWKPAWKEVDGLIAGDSAALAALAENRLQSRPWSPSALESFAVCPYKFALNGIFRLRPREDAAPLEELDPLTRGALFHEVQFDLLGELKRAGMLPLNVESLTAAVETADRTLNRVAERYAEELAPAVPRVWKSGIEDLRTDLRGWLQQVAQNDGDWLPLHFEYGFGLPARAGRDPESTEEEAQLPEGRALARIHRSGGKTYSHRNVAGDGSQDGQGSGEDSGVHGRRKGAATDAVRSGGGEATGRDGGIGALVLCDAARRVPANRDRGEPGLPAIRREAAGRHRRGDRGRFPAAGSRKRRVWDLRLPRGVRSVRGAAGRSKRRIGRMSGLDGLHEIRGFL